MILVLKLIFWLLILLIFYVYFGYPLFLYFLSFFVGRGKIVKADIQPSVSLIILSTDDKNKIRQKVENCLLLEYPRDKLEIIVVSYDFSDKINEVVSNYYKRGVKLFYQVEKKNKNVILNNCILQTKGEIIVFTDDTSLLDKYSIRNLIRNFADNKVGLVFGEIRYSNVNTELIVKGENLFLKWQKLVFTLSGKIKILTSINEELFAIRKELFEEIKETNIPYYIVMPLLILKKKFKILYEPLAVVNKEININLKENFQCKINKIIQSLYSVKYLKDLVISFRFLVIIQLVSYNILLNLTGTFAIISFFLNFLILVKPIYIVLLFLQILFYSAGLLKISYIPFYFSFISLSSVVAIVHLIKNKTKNFF